ncbi:MAG: zinc ABC transporter substrate-binding protein [Victivallales bacterium]|nr:zinc ABC transporter substrate-binding protein [Victivallales bacterium]
MTNRVLSANALIICFFYCLLTNMSAAESKRPVVFVSIGPQLESVRRIGGEAIDVHAMLPAGLSPETYSPNVRLMSALARADAYVTIGVPFEKSLIEKIRASFPNLKIVDGTMGMTFRRMEGGHHHHHDHDDDDDDHDGEAGEDDPHVWLGIENMKCHARTVATMLAELIPNKEHASLEARAVEYLRELDALFAELKTKLSSLRGTEAVVYHPAFGYFLDDFGIRQKAVELEGIEPGARYLGNVIREARRDGIHVIFVQPQFNAKAAEVLSHEIGGNVLPFDPLPNDYSDGLRRLAEAILEADSCRENKK